MKEQTAHLSILSNTGLVLERTDNRITFIGYLRKTKTRYKYQESAFHEFRSIAIEGVRYFRYPDHPGCGNNTPRGDIGRILYSRSVYLVGLPHAYLRHAPPLV
jgi:hypothetical protein